MIPGRMLHRLASCICNARSLHRVVEPAIADFQNEHATAVADRAPIRRARALLTGYAAVLQVIVLCVIEALVAIDSERRAVSRTLSWAAAITASVSGLVVILTLAIIPGISPYYVSLMAALVLPIAIPIGVALGIAFALSGRAVSSRTASAMVATAVIAACVSFWMTLLSPPVASQSFRQSVSNALGGRGVVVKAANDVSAFSILQRPDFAPGGNLRAWPRRQAWTKHMVLAMSFATPALVLFALAVVRRGAPRVLIIGGCAVYYVLVLAGEPLVHQGMPAAVAAWLANTMTVMAAGVLMKLPTSDIRQHT